MIDANPLALRILFHLGPLAISQAVVTTWVLMAVLVGFSAWATRRPRSARLHVVLEVLVETISGQIEDTMRVPPRPYLPLLATLFLFVLTANLSSLLPGIHAPTAHIETTGALALVVFVAVHGYGIKSRGFGHYLRHYLEPNPFLLPLTLLSELTRTAALMIRLFGNVMSHELVIAVVLGLAGLLVPVPIMALGLLIGTVQAYIFTVLAAVFLGAAMGAVEVG